MQHENMRRLIFLTVTFGLGLMFLPTLSFVLGQGPSIYDSLLLVFTGGVITIIAFIILSKRFYGWNIEKIVILILIISNFIGPEIFNVNIGIRVYLFRVVSFFLVCILFYKYFLMKNKFDISQIKEKYLVGFFLFWLSYGIISSIWSYSLLDHYVEMKYIISGVVLILLITYFFREEYDYVVLLNFWVLISMLFIILGCWSYLTGHHLPISRYNIIKSLKDNIPTATFVNENDYASFLNISVGIILGCIGYVKNSLHKLSLLVSIPLIILIVYITDSRSNLISIMLIILVWFLVFMNKRIRNLILIFSIVLVPLSMLVTSKVFTLISMIFEKIESIFVQEKSGQSTSIRVNLLKNSINFVEDSKGMGVGAGNGEFYIKYFSSFDTKGTLSLHNFWMEILVNYGLLIFFGIILTYIYLLIRLYYFWNNYRKNEFHRYISSSLFLALVGFPLAVISPSSSLPLGYVWMIMAFSVGYINSQRVKERFGKL
ncbi:MAG: hypothetical protein K0S51_1491 [Bacillales bacterium]|jgi:teichuronic acid biosynthesis protein TuaE|nr:hypothetical protein [Bacillales bacterium]